MQPRNRDELLGAARLSRRAGARDTANVRGRVRAREASNGYRVTVDGRDGLRINDQLVAMPDIEASNGVIQGINAVLSPPVLVANAGASGK